MDRQNLDEIEKALNQLDTGLGECNNLFQKAIQDMNTNMLLPLAEAHFAVKRAREGPPPEMPALLQPIPEMKMEATSAPTFSELLTEYLDLRDKGPDVGTDKNYYTRIVEIPKLLDEIIYGRRTN